MKKLSTDKKGVFGLTAVQTFFAVVLGIALLAYVIVIIFGTLGGNTILAQASGLTNNQTTAAVTETGVTLATTLDNPTCTIRQITNATSGTLINSPNYTATNCLIKFSGATDTRGYNGSLWNVTYTYIYNSQYQTNLNTILTNTSTGITSFFTSINPVYAILAVLVIILILVVLVRVVQAPSGSSAAPQL